MDELLPTSLEDFQKYIDDNNIKSKRDFRLLNKYLYNRYIRLIPKENRLLKFKEEYYHHFDYLSTVEDFQRFINDNNIKRPVEFRKRFPKEYDRMLRALSKEDKAKLIYEVRINSYSNISTINNLQEFIEINEVHSRKELHKLYPGLYVKFSRELDKVNFINSSSSLGENYLKKLFKENNIKFITEKTFSDLKNILPLRYDFYLRI